MTELTVDATVDNIKSVTDFVDKQLGAFGCPTKTKMQIDIAIDELFSNIAHYAYAPDVGSVRVLFEVIKNPLAVIITFIDRGVQYNPLTGKEPDITLGAQERRAGGLGIYIVKNIMDEITYEYRDSQNILKIKKNI